MAEIDTAGGPGFGSQHFRTNDFLKPGEVVLTFDDGPWPGNTPAVLAALAAQCTKATFFAIGKHAMWQPDILKEVAAAGHSVGSHTWSHVDLMNKSSADARDEIEKGISVVQAAVGGPIAPFFRFPQLNHPPEMITYLEKRNIAIFSIDLDSSDFEFKNPEQVITSVMAGLIKNGKGIVRMHDFHTATTQALPDLLKELKVNGYRVVHLAAKKPVVTLPSYDALILKRMKGATTVRTASQDN